MNGNSYFIQFECELRICFFNFNTIREKQSKRRSNLNKSINYSNVYSEFIEINFRNYWISFSLTLKINIRIICSENWLSKINCQCIAFQCPSHRCRFRCRHFFDKIFCWKSYKSFEYRSLRNRKNIDLKNCFKPNVL